ncbi:D-alanyl-D-alanine carboxypeptidase family protein [Paraburkholderia tropica]|uniref:serine-type D-Ala-D-Ala carboxypeptidase n=1 Tax=Paraburkholderia tropica TaxID=92647 RepID=A0ABX5MDB2_9BURK|nr:D-alanyl-D-alanine carboxypeptidase family protein [Paraburkholderia tropica]PXX05287.1 D-alanyl-D-alanine carboxypeptidase (penicillin-binding protein 5/6) [Paraburkholderia tropica]PZW70606.1 D-alanyl-D-alanine carboxypeptidase (penicillin-binding protein 5/6) [Paraburkholderia tropica]QNB17419.1 D-alanyl-D-alanine carboxypeptidase [Paraburkholderia tropica]
MRRTPCRLSLFSFPRRTVCAAFITALTALTALTSTEASAQVAPPALQARAWVLMDAGSDQILASSNADARAEPASLTKLMSAYLVFQALHAKRITMDQTVLPGEAVRSVGTDESRMFIEPNKPVSVHDLLYGLIVQSGNDAAIALAELVGGSQAQFVQMMNAEAASLGMAHTHFSDVNGMPSPQHFTSAGDLATLTAHIISDFPEYYPIFSTKTFTYDRIRQPNRNRLLWLDPSVDGLKTGHTQAAGYCLIASAIRDVEGAPGTSRRVISVVMGEPTEPARVADSLKLLNFAYHAFDAVPFFRVGQAISLARVYKGTRLNVDVAPTQNVVATIPAGTRAQITSSIKVNTPLFAPLSAGEQVGTVTILDQGKVLTQVPLATLWAVPQAGLLDRAWDSLQLMLGSKV